MPEQTNPSASLPNESASPPSAAPLASSTAVESPVDALTRPVPRTRTMVFGLILLVISGCVLIAQLTSIHLDAGAVALTVMVIAGLMLVAGGRRNAN